MYIQDTMKDTEKKLSWREKQLLDIINASPTPITTRKTYQLADMAKATALKYLAVLEAKELVEFEYFGPTKLWWIIERCPKCDTIMKRIFILQCPNCNYEKGGKEENGKSKQSI